MSVPPARRRLALLSAAIVLVVALPVAAGAQGASPADPTDAVLCEGLSIFQPTSICSVYDPETETSTNPYTEDGDSPGILDLGLLGLL